MNKPKKIRKSRIRTDRKGEFIYRHHFLNGRQKLTKVYLVDGIPSDEINLHDFYLEDANDISPMEDGEYENMGRRYIVSIQSSGELIDNPLF